MGRVVVVIALIIILGIGLYAYNARNTTSTSGTSGAMNSFWQSLMPHYPTSTSGASSYSPTPIAPSYSSTGSGGTVSTQNPPAPPAVNPADIPPGFTADQLSPYFHQVRFGGVSVASIYSYGSYGQITLNASWYQTDQGTSTIAPTIDVTGWQIKSNRGGEYIPQAVNVYDPLGLAPVTDIRLRSGDYLYIYSSSAPVNLRINKCMGYLPNKTQFNPQLPQNCPYTDRSQIQSFSGACQNYIASLGSCQSPNLANPNIPQNDYACLDYLNTHFNYKSCFDEHQADTDFLTNEIRVWTGSSPIDPFHDKVDLLDRNGLLVDYYSY